MVAFDEWEITEQNVSAIAEVSTAAPVVGARSLRLSNQTISGFVFTTVLRHTDVSRRALTSGRVRALIVPGPGFDFSVVTHTGFTASTGIYCMRNQLAVWDTGGQCYVGAIGMGIGGLYEWRIDKFTNGTANRDPTVLASGNSTNLPIVAGNIAAMELAWTLNPGVPSVDLVLRTGVQTNFSDLTQIYAITDAATPHQTTIGEGVGEFFYPQAGFGAFREWFIDEITHYPV